MTEDVELTVALGESAGGVVDNSEDEGPSESSGFFLLPKSLDTLFLAGILAGMVLTILYFARSVAIPIAFAVLLNLLLQPAVRVLTRLGSPKSIAAAFVLVVLIGGVTGLAYGLSAPATTWVSRVTDEFPRLEQRLSTLRRPIEAVQNTAKQVEQATEDPNQTSRVAVKETGLSSLLFEGTRDMLVGSVTTALLLFYLLVSGDMFLRRLVEILPRFGNKKQAVEIAHEIQHNISRYLVTITLMNALVGVATGVTAYLCGLQGAVLWGAIAFLLNYVLIFGPLAGIGVFLLAGLLTFDGGWQAISPAGIYLVIHVIEGEVITPLLVARRFILNPVIIIVSLVFWYWMWGVAGALLAVPFLATIKIVCDRIPPLMAFGHFLSAEPPAS
jgi:predicted PurR-regulated permease PerM